MYVDANSQAFVRAISQYDNLRSFTTPMKRMTRKLVGRDKEMRSVSAAMERAELSNVILLADAGSGKLLPLDTPIPTPTGWTTMGALRPGDMVLGRDGKPTMVTFTSAVDENPELYELEFSDGTKQVACVDHQWLVSDVTQRNYGNASHSAIDVRAEERSRGYLDVMLEHDDVEYVTVRELVELIADVPHNTWHSHNSLLQYLLGCGVSHKDVVFEERQSWKGMTRLTRVHREMVSFPESLRALASQPRRARHGSDERVMTTGDMLRAGLVTASGRRRFSVQIPRPLDLPEADLPVDPYVLGVWLGDGHSHIQKNARITSADVDMMRWVEAAGYPVCRIANDNAGAANTYTFVGLGDGLASIGMSEGKHIPIEYLRASYDQRLALLQGIMDTNGSISSVGTAAISLSDERLASDVEELIHTLGIKVVRHVSDSSYRDADGSIVKCRDRHRMTFTTTQQIFRLSRKACRIPKEVRKTQERLYLVGIRPVKSVAGKCIQVANTDHVYLCGKNFLPTHNTALVQGLMERDENRIFLEVDLSRMIAAAKNPDEIGNMLKGLFDEASRFGREQGHDIVLFMDEFHQIVQLSAAAVEALKPLLADSATRGIRVIAATTYEEFRRYISDNQPLVERLQRINVPEPDKETTVEILRGMAERYGVADDIIGNALYEAIYDVTQRHIPANAQPRKSILVLDAMVGWHRAEHKQFNNKLLADVIFESEGINIAFSVDSQTIKRELDKHVLAQTYATRVVEERLQLCVAGLNDQSKPQSSFLLCGPTGVGKLVSNSTPVPAISPEDGSLIYINHGDLKVGDTVFDAHGEPTKVLGTFPHKNVPMYRVTLSDGRSLDVGDNHLWAVYSEKLRRKVQNEGKPRDPYIMTTQELVDAGVVQTYSRDSRRHLKWFIPMNEAVVTKPLDLLVDPYVVGAFIGNGCLTLDTLGLSSDDIEVVSEVGRLIHASGYCSKSGSYTWNYSFDDATVEFFGNQWAPCQGNAVKYIKTATLFGDMPEIMGVKSAERRIPARYMNGSIEQRWSLVQGLFDTDGSVSNDDRVRVTYSTFSKGLAEDIVQLLFSLGISSKISSYYREREVDGRVTRDLLEYTVRVRCDACDKPRFFRLERKRARAMRAMDVKQTRKRVKKFGMVGIESIEPIGTQSAQCIYVDNDEHLYQAGQFVVTHNTELTKQLSKLLFGDATRSLIRIDMSEYANPDSLERFRLEITARVWEHPYCIVLLDEVEKACPEVTRVLLSVLDDARLSDRNGREVSFLNCYFVLTTNAGNEIYRTIAQYEADDSGDGSFLARYDRLIRRSLTASTGGVKFPPELLGRIDCIVPFQPLSYNTMRQICVMRLRELRRKLLDKYSVDMSVENRVVTYLVEDSLTTDSDAGGARAVMAKLEGEVTTAIARFINMHPDIRNIHVEIEGELASENKTRITSDACVKIKGVVG